MFKSFVSIISIIITISVFSSETAPIYIMGDFGGIDGQFEFEGPLASAPDLGIDFVEGGDARFQFMIIDGKFRSAKEIAVIFQKKLLGSFDINAPVLCGYHAMGKVSYTAVSDLQYNISASGDGGVDTCTNQGGPGYWGYEIELYLAKDHSRGNVILSWASE